MVQPDAILATIAASVTGQLIVKTASVIWHKRHQEDTLIEEKKQTSLLGSIARDLRELRFVFLGIPTQVSKPPMLNGCDISYAQGDAVDFNALKNAVDFVIIRMSYGTLIDSCGARNRDEARRVGLPRGYYHYAYPTFNQPEAEADTFLNQIGDLQDGEILFLDWDNDEFEKNFPDPAGWCLRFMNRVKDRLNGYKAVLYTNLSTARGKNWAPIIQNDHGLWVAYYNDTTDNNESNPWPVTAFKQHTSSGSLPGISGGVDLDVFYGDLDQFSKYGYHHQAPPAAVIPPPVINLMSSGTTWTGPIPENHTIIVTPTTVDAIQPPSDPAPIQPTTNIIPMKPGWKSSEFWTHIAVSASSLGTGLGTMFDTTYTNAHPLLAGMITIGCLLVAGISQFAYTISRGIAKKANNA